jgi:tetratricopeptide (TPR) repeat protein
MTGRRAVGSVFTRLAATLAGCFVLAAFLGAGPNAAYAQGSSAGRILVMPFETARDPKIYWLGEAVSVLLAEDLSALGALAFTRDERLQAFERLQVPPMATLSFATVIKTGQQLGAAQVLTGALRLEGDDLEVRARILRLDTGRLQSEFVERGPLADIFATCYRVARRMVPNSTATIEQVEHVHPSLIAFENYIKGILAETPARQVAYLTSAIKLAPQYDAPKLALWALYDEQGEHERALAAAQAVPQQSRLYTRAQFVIALSQLQLKRYDDAFATLRPLSEAAPTAAVLNNLGVIQVRRGSSPQYGRPTYYFNKAAEADRDDPDYDFNLGYAYWLDRDAQAAMYWLREAVRRNPADGDAHFVLAAALAAAGSTAEAARERELARQLSSKYADWERKATSADPVPRGLERVKSGLELRAQRVDTALTANEQRDQRELAAFHLERGRRLYEQDNDREAVTELRRSLYLSPYQAEANLLLGRIYLRTGRTRDAIDTLKISIWSEDTAAAHVALGEAYLQAKDAALARAEADRALALDPSSADARKLLERIR